MSEKHSDTSELCVEFIYIRFRLNGALPPEMEGNDVTKTFKCYD